MLNKNSSQKCCGCCPNPCTKKVCQCKCCPRNDTKNCCKS